MMSKNLKNKISPMNGIRTDQSTIIKTHLQTTTHSIIVSTKISKKITTIKTI